MRGSCGGPVYFEITSSSLEHASSESRVRQALGEHAAVDPAKKRFENSTSLDAVEVLQPQEQSKNVAKFSLSDVSLAIPGQTSENCVAHAASVHSLESSLSKRFSTNGCPPQLHKHDTNVASTNCVEKHVSGNFISHSFFVHFSGSPTKR
jgi:hypothetical protein